MPIRSHNIYDEGATSRSLNVNCITSVSMTFLTFHCLFLTLFHVPLSTCMLATEVLTGRWMIRFPLLNRLPNKVVCISVLMNNFWMSLLVRPKSILKCSFATLTLVGFCSIRNVSVLWVHTNSSYRAIRIHIRGSTKTQLQWSRDVFLNINKNRIQCFENHVQHIFIWIHCTTHYFSC